VERRIIILILDLVYKFNAYEI